MEIFMVKSMQTVFLVLIMIFIGSAAYAEQGAGEQSDFVSSTLSDVFGRVGDYASGERDIIKDHDDSEEYVEYDDTNLNKGVSRPSRRPKKDLPENPPIDDPAIKISGSISGK